MAEDDASSGDFNVIILGRTCEEWAGVLSTEHGRAGFADFGSPLDVANAIELMVDDSLFDAGALRAAVRIVLCLVDSCQPKVGEVLVSGTSVSGKAVALDSRRVDFNDRDALETLPTAHLILHDRRTLGIFAFGDCIPFLASKRLAPSGSFLLHGLRPDALHDMTAAGRLEAIAALVPPPALNDAGSQVFAVTVQVDFEQHSGDGPTSCPNERGSTRISLPCHPDDTVTNLRLRLYDIWRRQPGGACGETSAGRRWEIPVGFNLGAASRSTGGSPWFPARQHTLVEALKAAKLDASGRFSSNQVPTPLPETAGGDSGDTSQSHPRRRVPILRPYGTAGIPLRRYALAEMLGVAHDCGVEGCGDHHLLEFRGFTRMRTLPANICCPLTGANGLVAIL